MGSVRSLHIVPPEDGEVGVFIHQSLHLLAGVVPAMKALEVGS